MSLPVRIPLSRRASLTGDLRIAWRSILGLFWQLLRTRSSRRGGRA